MFYNIVHFIVLHQFADGGGDAASRSRVGNICKWDQYNFVYNFEQFCTISSNVYNKL